jgi:hypothetical protein
MFPTSFREFIIEIGLINFERTLSTKKKKYLKSLINKEIPTIQIGKEGITDNIIKHINSVIESSRTYQDKKFSIQICFH